MKILFISFTARNLFKNYFLNILRINFFLLIFCLSKIMEKKKVCKLPEMGEGEGEAGRREGGGDFDDLDLRRRVFSED